MAKEASHCVYVSRLQLQPTRAREGPSLSLAAAMRLSPSRVYPIHGAAPLNNATCGPAYALGDADAIRAGAARGPGPHVVAGWRRPRPRGGRAGPVGESERGREIGHLLEKQRAEGGPRELGARGHPPPRRRRARTETEPVRDRERRARAACLPVGRAAAGASS